MSTAPAVTHLLHAQAMSEDEFESMKRELPGSGASTLRFAESAEQQHIDMNHSLNELAEPILNDALATRLAPAQGPSNFIQPAPVQPPTQVSVLKASWLVDPTQWHLIIAEYSLYAVPPETIQPFPSFENSCCKAWHEIESI